MASLPLAPGGTRVSPGTLRPELSNAPEGSILLFEQSDLSNCTVRRSARTPLPIAAMSSIACRAVMLTLRIPEDLHRQHFAALRCQGGMQQSCQPSRRRLTLANKLRSAAYAGGLVPNSRSTSRLLRRMRAAAVIAPLLTSVPWTSAELMSASCLTTRCLLRVRFRSGLPATYVSGTCMP